MAAVHALFLPACAAEVLLLHRPFPGALGWACAATAVCAQILRWWAIRSLGWRWNVRVIVVPGEPPVRKGPYRFLRHPNYLAVAVEMLWLVVGLEDRFRVALKEEDAAAVRTVADLAALVLRRREEARAC